MHDISFFQRFADAAEAFAPGLIAIITSGVISGAFWAMTQAHQRWPDTRRGRFLARLTTPPGRSHVIWAIMFLGFLWAAFGAFDATNVENYKLKAKVAEVSDPKFSISIKQIVIGVPGPTEKRQGALIHTFIVVTNTGAPASILAASWIMKLTLPNGVVVEGEPSTLDDAGRQLCIEGGKEHFSITRSDDLSLRASQTIDRNGYKDGYLGFIVLGMRREQVLQSTTGIIVAAQDIYQRTYTTSTTVGEAMKNSRTVFMPSLSKPHPEPGC
jgi:hypothetical protein